MAALVREFDTTPRKSGAKASAIQETELSATPRAAAKAYDAIVDWYAGCAEPRAQLISTQRVDGVADEAMLIELKTWGQPNWTYVAGIARTGLITTTTLSRTTADGPSDLPASARLLAAAVNGVCHQPDAGACPTKPRLRAGPADPGGHGPRHGRRGRPAARRRRPQPVGRHRAAQGDGQRRGRRPATRPTSAPRR